MSHILSPENILISLLSGYNTYFCTENRAQLPTSDRPALVLQHLRSNETFYAIAIATPYIAYNNMAFIGRWRRLVEYPCGRGFLWPIDLVYQTNGENQCYLVYPFRNMAPYKSMSELSKTRKFFGLDHRMTRDIAMAFLNAYESLERNNYLYFGLDDDDIFINTLDGRVLIPINERISIDKRERLSFTNREYLSEVIDPYCYANRKITPGSNDVYSYDIDSERYAFISILFRLLIGLYPYEGPYMDEYEYNVESENNRDWIFHYLQNPVFIFDENDTSNSIANFNKNEEHLKRWGMLTERLRGMFANTFVSDNVMRRGTVTQYAAAEWRAALEECFRETKPID